MPLAASRTRPTSDNKSYVKLLISPGFWFSPPYCYGCKSSISILHGGHVHESLCGSIVRSGYGIGHCLEPRCAGDDEPKKSDKVQAVGKNGLKIDAKITDDDKKVEFSVDIGGKEITLPAMAAKVFSVKLEGNKKYTIRLDTDDDDLDPFLVVQDGAGKTVGFDDDGGGKLNSKLIFSPAKDGTFKVYAAALRGTGSLTVKISAADGGGVAPKGAELQVGKKIEGTLSQAVKTVSYKIKLEEDKEYVIDMISPDQMALDPYLILKDANGKILAKDDDGGEGLNARLKFKAPATAVYTIEATSFGQVGVGEFTLEVRKE